MWHSTAVDSGSDRPVVSGGRQRGQKLRPRCVPQADRQHNGRPRGPPSRCQRPVQCRPTFSLSECSTRCRSSIAPCGYSSRRSAKRLRIFFEVGERPFNKPTYLFVHFRNVSAILGQCHPACLYRLPNRAVDMARAEHLAHLFHWVSLVVVISAARFRDGMVNMDCHACLLVRDNKPAFTGRHRADRVSIYQNNGCGTGIEFPLRPRQSFSTATDFRSRVGDAGRRESSTHGFAGNGVLRMSHIPSIHC